MHYPVIKSHWLYFVILLTLALISRPLLAAEANDQIPVETEQTKQITELLNTKNKIIDQLSNLKNDIAEKKRILLLKIKNTTSAARARIERLEKEHQLLADRLLANQNKLTNTPEDKEGSSSIQLENEALKAEMERILLLIQFAKSDYTQQIKQFNAALSEYNAIEKEITEKYQRLIDNIDSKLKKYVAIVKTITPPKSAVIQKVTFTGKWHVECRDNRFEQTTSTLYSGKLLLNLFDHTLRGEQQLNHIRTQVGEKIDNTELYDTSANLKGDYLFTNRTIAVTNEWYHPEYQQLLTGKLIGKVNLAEENSDDSNQGTIVIETNTPKISCNGQWSIDKRFKD